MTFGWQTNYDFLLVVKKKPTENYKGLPYITTILGHVCRLYGFLKLDGVLVLIVNGIDAIFQFIYGTLFLIYFSVG